MMSIATIGARLAIGVGLLALSTAGYSASSQISGSQSSGSQSTSSTSRGLLSVMENAGIEKNSLAHFQVLNTLNIRPFVAPDETGIGDVFQVCKRRWLSSPFGTWQKYSTESVVKSTMTSGDNKIIKEAFVYQTVNTITDDSFQLSIYLTEGDKEKQENHLNVTRNDYIVTCLETIEKQQKMDKILGITYQHDEPYLDTHTTKTESFRTMVKTVNIEGTFPEGGTFQEQSVRGSAYFWAYAQGLYTNEASLVMDKSGTIQGIMQLETTVTRVYTRKEDGEE